MIICNFYLYHITKISCLWYCHLMINKLSVSVSYVSASSVSCKSVFRNIGFSPLLQFFIITYALCITRNTRFKVSEIAFLRQCEENCTGLDNLSSKDCQILCILIFFYVWLPWKEKFCSKYVISAATVLYQVLSYKPKLLY